MGLDVYPLTSGSKGIHLYAPLDGSATSQEISDVAHELARSLESDHRDLIEIGRASCRERVSISAGGDSAKKVSDDAVAAQERSDLASDVEREKGMESGGACM